MRSFSTLARGSAASLKRLPFLSTGARAFSCSPQLLQQIETLAQAKAAQTKELKSKYGSYVLGEVTVEQCIGGMRGIKGMICETSDLDVEEGIRFRGYTIKELQAKLPTAPGGTEPLPEGLIWLLMTGNLPSEAETKIITEELRKRQEVPAHVMKVLESLPPDTHPMTQLVTAVTALQTESVFAKAYAEGVKKSEYWKLCLEDAFGVVSLSVSLSLYSLAESEKDDLVESSPID
uniref:Citrate synthase n=1 Tax=Chromera velia CCMP2878 TaxID=1169474 RepID=A0A0G4HNC7_9ALVE|eukprot:Cvel_29416.t1-p1 / transcript=Cvel_29416.t1 / gene=Cvel_29416 / organism=Chromera_velia_CCMP2878 / gene_product=Citrate synthase, mitochondrial, putative / transcript_product=Citrate synthase, mitochondrial, putative / location=Cvel_scaffold4015:10993-11691(+) / protein_length=233 / sequence_SO=supercontig / SO=protein_coding / is_pseudo=false